MAIDQVYGRDMDATEGHDMHKADVMLALMGHPGYGEEFAQKVLDIMGATGYDAWHVIYNGWGWGDDIGANSYVAG